ncbi:MAG: hypothetical protein V9G15_09325 [Dermatophilaceae bacterium]|nr:hypothetical protein [Actinomycetales bacterium]
MTANADDVRVERARAVLLSTGASDLVRQPWRHSRQPADDVTLLRYAVWRTASGRGSVSAEEIEAGLGLIESARAELDALETALVFNARAEGMTWGQVAAAMGLRSPQGAQQRYLRTTDRPAARSDLVPDIQRD